MQIGWGKLMANFHPNLMSCSWENVYIRILSLKTWWTPQKNLGKLRKNAESLSFIEDNMFTTFQTISLSSSLTKNPNFQPSQLHSHRWPRRRASKMSQCSPVCPFENDNCCMACLLSKQEDFRNQISMLETVIWETSHECIFLPKFHCELNPIEMVSSSYLLRYSLIYFLSTIVLGMGPDG